MKPQVIIDLEEYNRLIKAEELIKSGKKCVVTKLNSRDGSRCVTSYYTESEIIEDLERNIESLSSELMNIRADNFAEILKIKDMSVFEFKKWRKS